MSTKKQEQQTKIFDEALRLAVEVRNNERVEGRAFSKLYNKAEELIAYIREYNEN